MMTETDILTLITNGENSQAEFKEQLERNHPERIAREIVGFANMHGGYILVGVSDFKDIVGIQNENTQSWLMDTVIMRYVHPTIIPEYDEVTIDERTIAVIKVHVGVSKPYAVRHNNREDVYIRVGDTCQLASREQIQRLFESGGMLFMEKLPIPGSSIEELDERKLRQYFLEILEYDENVWHENIQNILLDHSFLNSPDGTDSIFCSYFACALFAYSPRLRLPQSGIRLMVFDGEEMDYNAKMDEILNLPFIGLGENGDSNHSDYSLPDHVMKYLQPHISRDIVDASQHMQRKRHWDYAPDAIRELIINAFAHRDWTRQDMVWVVVYDNRMEVKSPGSLPNGMTIKKVIAGERAPRNTKISDILRDYGFIEARGMGIRRKVIPLTLKKNGKEPLFEATEDYFKVTLLKD